jgi:hypothetical protein
MHSKFSSLKQFAFAILLSSFFCNQLNGQTIEAYPSNWFVQMKYNKVQILLRKPGSFKNNAQVQVNYPGVTLSKTHHFVNPNYLAVDIEISKSAKPGLVKLLIKEGDQATSFNWTLKARRVGNGTQFAQGVNSKDFIYFLMPDRFSNGDKSNDKVAGLKDQSLNRDSIFLRHGGDLQGVLNHLDYLG